MLIRGVVYDDDADEALSVAKAGVFDRLVADDVFDYYVTADMEGNGVAGTDRWGDYPVAAPVDTDEGRHYVDEGAAYTCDAYERHLTHLADFFDDHSFADLWEEEAVHRRFHHDFHRIGEYAGPATYLYDQHGQGIRYRKQLDDILDGDVSAADGDAVYVVPADVHY